ncbi:MAG: hypothetical protein WB524_05305, partial [Acidobacteriaceae bacterium]
MDEGLRRRDFLKIAGAAAVGGLSRGSLAAAAGGIFILVDGADVVASSGPVRWAAERLCSELAAKGTQASVVTSAQEAAGAALVVVAAGPHSDLAKHFSQSGAELGAECFRLISGKVGRTPAVLVSATDARGFVYGLLELAERVQYGAEARAALHGERPLEERPANEVRSVGRYFCCELEDKPWYYDKEFWRGYLDTLAASRFNRFCLAFGLEYDFPRGVTDDYLHFPYPYLVDVPGYADVRVVQLAAEDGQRLATPRMVSAEEKARNLAMLKFIAAETGARGLQFQLGIWTHAYQWT